MRARKVTWGVAVVLVCSLAVAGCGGGDSDADSGSDGTQPTTDTKSSGGGGGSTAGGSAFFANADCRQLARAFDQSTLGRSLTSGDDPTEDLRATAEFLQEASDDAPAEVAGDVETLADAYADLADRSEDVDWAGIRAGNIAAAAGAATLGQTFADADFARAAQNLASFVAESCTR